MERVPVKSTEHGSCAISMLRIGEFGQGDGLSRSYRIRSKGVGVGSCVHGQCYFPPTAAACLIISTAGNTVLFFMIPALRMDQAEGWMGETSVCAWLGR